jgi:hypothetical protein
MFQLVFTNLLNYKLVLLNYLLCITLYAELCITFGSKPAELCVIFFTSIQPITHRLGPTDASVWKLVKPASSSAQNSVGFRPGRHLRVKMLLCTESSPLVTHMENDLLEAGAYPKCHPTIVPDKRFEAAGKKLSRVWSTDAP